MSQLQQAACFSRLNVPACSIDFLFDQEGGLYVLGVLVSEDRLDDFIKDYSILPPDIQREIQLLIIRKARDVREKSRLAYEHSLENSSALQDQRCQ
jgi:hypothetical protein